MPPRSALRAQLSDCHVAADVLFIGFGSSTALGRQQAFSTPAMPAPPFSAAYAVERGRS